MDNVALTKCSKDYQPIALKDSWPLVGTSLSWYVRT